MTHASKKLSNGERAVMAALFVIARPAKPIEITCTIRQLIGPGVSVSRLYGILGDLSDRRLIDVRTERVLLGSRRSRSTFVAMSRRGLGLGALCAREFAGATDVLQKRA